MSGMPDTSTIDTYGGVLVNYDSIVDPTTDRDATAMDQALEDCAQMTHTATRAWARFTLAATSGAIVRASSDAAWGNTVPPTAARGSTGTFVFTWPATVTDGLGNSHSVNLKWAEARIEGSTFGFANASVYTSPYQVLLYTGNAAGAANDLVGITVLLKVG